MTKININNYISNEHYYYYHGKFDQNNDFEDFSFCADDFLDRLESFPESVLGEHKKVWGNLIMIMLLFPNMLSDYHKYLIPGTIAQSVFLDRY